MGKFKMPPRLVVPFYALCLSAVAVLAYFIAKWAGAYNPNAYLFFTIAGVFALVIAFVYGRQLWWFIAGKEDYAGREGLLKRLYKKIFKK